MMTAAATARSKRASIQNTVWLRSHGVNERRLAKTIEQYFNAQADKICAAIIKVGALPPVLSQIVNHPAEENAKLLKLVKPDLYRMMTLGAHLEFEAVAPRSAAGKSFAQPGELMDPYQLPPNVQASIKQALDTLAKQKYWIAIQRQTHHILTDCIQSGIEDGGGVRDIVKRVQDGLGGAGGKARAKKIARTETTGAMNAGHYEARKHLIDEGLIKGTEWLGLSDNRQRATHAALDGTTVKGSDLFNVGGYFAPYPGHYSLPAAQRVNCRCTTVAADTFADEHVSQPEIPATPAAPADTWTDQPTLDKIGDEAKRMLAVDAFTVDGNAATSKQTDDANAVFSDLSRAVKELPALRDAIGNHPELELYGVRVEYADLLTDEDGTPHKNAGGLYWLKRQKIELLSSPAIDRDGPLKWNAHNVDFTLTGSARHEYGHHVHEALGKVNVALLAEWQTIYESCVKQHPVNGGVSEYAATNHRELFAESFCAYTHEYYLSGTMPSLVENFLKRVLSGKVFGG